MNHPPLRLAGAPELVSGTWRRAPGLAPHQGLHGQVAVEPEQKKPKLPPSALAPATAERLG